MPARIETLATTPWLALKNVFLPTSRGEEKAWTYATRPDCAGAVCVIATTADPAPEIVLVRQFRAPVGKAVIEFPAGLMDAGESPVTTGLRELAEETGWSGNVTHVSPATFPSPGLTDEAIYFIEVTLETCGECQPEEDETIEVLRWPLAELRTQLEIAAKRGDGIDSKLWNYAVGRR